MNAATAIGKSQMFLAINHSGYAKRPEGFKILRHTGDYLDLKTGVFF
jgi:hypothetical protein